MEGLRVSDADLVVYIHPSRGNKIKEAVLHQLSSALLFQFNEAFGGIVLAYDEDIESNKGKILSGIVPCFGVRVKAMLLVFSPKPDMLLEGKIVKLGKESIHIIVLGFSSAAITFEDIRKEFEYRTKNGEDVFGSIFYEQHVIKVGSIIRFLVKSFDDEMLHFSGSLIPSNTGCVHWLYRHECEKDRIIKKQRENDLGMKVPEKNSKDCSHRISSIRQHKWKRRKTA